jgi:hypothetical protein
VSVSPTGLSIAELERDGWLVALVEQNLRHSYTTRDLFGFVDLLALKPGRTLAVQTTTTSNQSKRVAKVLASPHFGRVLAAGWEVHVHGWAWSRRTNDWVLTTTDLTDRRAAA